MQSASQAPQINRAHGEALHKLVDIFTDSFDDDPVLNWVMPSRNLYPSFFRLAISEVFLPQGLAHMESSANGAALWLPPGVEFHLPPRLATVSMISRLLLRHGLEVGRRAKEQSQVFATHRPQQPHYHLVFVGAKSQAQGKGIGSALLKNGTALCDQAAMPAYLESSKEANVALYQRHGFEVLAQQSLPRGGPPVWFMWREPRKL